MGCKCSKNKFLELNFPHGVKIINKNDPKQKDIAVPTGEIIFYRDIHGLTMYTFIDGCVDF